MTRKAPFFGMFFIMAPWLIWFFLPILVLMPVVLFISTKPVISGLLGLGFILVFAPLFFTNYFLAVKAFFGAGTALDQRIAYREEQLAQMMDPS